MAEVVYINGTLVSQEEARVSIFDRGFLYGDGLFETMRSYSGQVFRLEHHLSRLFSALKILNISIPFNTPQLKKAVYYTLKANNLNEAYIRLAISRGEGSLGPNPAGCVSPNVIIIAKKFEPYPAISYEGGLKAVVVSTRQNAASPLSQMKSANFLNYILARMEATSKGVDEGILLNTEGYVAEATTSNIFIVKDRTLFTPSEGSGILPGITRQAILEISSSTGIIKAFEKKVVLDELFESQECFLTNTLMEIMPLVEIDGIPIGNGKPGPLTIKLHQAYQELVKKEVGWVDIPTMI